MTEERHWTVTVHKELKLYNKQMEEQVSPNNIITTLHHHYILRMISNDKDVSDIIIASNDTIKLSQYCLNLLKLTYRLRLSKCITEIPSFFFFFDKSLLP